MANQPKKEKKTEKDETKVGPRRPLLRSRDDRMLWGVAGGLADHLGFNATLVRVAFVVITLFGGAGLLAYLVLAVALPEDDGTGQPVDESVWARLGKVVLVCILVAIALVLAAGIAAVSAWITATGHGTVVAVAVIALGFALVAAAFATDVRRRLTPPLVVLALVLGIPAGAGANALRNVTLDDKYELESGRVYVTGVQALVRLLMLQRQRDVLAGLNTAGFVSGYRGSPLGGLDYQFQRAASHLAPRNTLFQAAMWIWTDWIGSKRLRYQRRDTAGGGKRSERESVNEVFNTLRDVRPLVHVPPSAGLPSLSLKNSGG